MKRYEGAEATVEISGGKAVKKRHSKAYRHRDLDERLRTERTESELKLMKRASKYGANVPEVERTDDFTLEIEEIGGSPLKQIVADRPELLKELGENIAFMHSAGVIHGDLTTSNVLFDEDVYLIDFGLAFRSERDEDRAVDIHLLKQVLDTSHPEISEQAWNYFLEGYSELEGQEDVLETLEEVEKRGRYK